MQIPDTFALGVQSCLDKCKIKRGDQPKYQQQPTSGYDSPGFLDSPDSPDDGDTEPHYNQGGNFGGDDHQPPSDDESEIDWDNDEWDEGGYDDGDSGVDSSEWGDNDYN